MTRRLLNLLTALSLPLSAAAAVLWVRSYRRGDRVDFVSGRVDRGDYLGVWGDVSSLNGGVGLYLVRQCSDAADVRRYWPDLLENKLRRRPADRGGDARRYPPVQVIPDWHVGGFNGVRRSHQNEAPTPSGRRADQSQWGITLPWWFLTLLLTAPAAAALRRELGFTAGPFDRRLAGGLARRSAAPTT